MQGIKVTSGTSGGKMMSTFTWNGKDLWMAMEGFLVVLGEKPVLFSWGRGEGMAVISPLTPGGSVRRCGLTVTPDFTGGSHWTP